MFGGKKIFIYGAGDQGRVVLRILLDLKSWKVSGFIDDNVKEGSTFEGIRVYGSREALTMSRQVPNAVTAIGINRNRADAYRRLKAHGFTLPSIVHPTANVCDDVTIGEGTVVCPGAILWTKAKVGENCIVNTGAILEHDNVLEDHVHVASGTRFGGKVRVKEFAFVGTGAVVLPYVTVGKAVTVGAGSVVTKPVPDGVVVAGVPAHILHGERRHQGHKGQRGGGHEEQRHRGERHKNQNPKPRP